MKGIEGGAKAKGVEKNSNTTLEYNDSIELKESIDKAKKLREELEVYSGTDVIGQVALDEVEKIASELSRELENISAEICLKEGLPYHPTDKKSV